MLRFTRAVPTSLAKRRAGFCPYACADAAAVGLRRTSWNGTRRLPLLTPVVGLVAAVALAAGCRSAPRRAPRAPCAPPTPTPTPVSRYAPAHDLGPLFQDVQLSGIFADSKTFVDARPLSPPP